MAEVFQMIERVADTDVTVLIRGESGTGKELICRAIHNLSPRRDGPFVAVNCAALPDTLLESELFGYKAGAFTDARIDKPGRFALAGGGTILLDEIGDMSPALQVRLLRLLQEKVYEPLGATEPVTADVRVLAATNRNLDDLVKQGTFRNDLFYRINVVRLYIPPLRDRRDDIPLLVNHFIDHFNTLYSRGIERVSDSAMAAILEHRYPGNIRELENAIEHAFVLCRGSIILPEHLPGHFRELAKPASHENRPDTLREIERDAITEALRRNRYNRLVAARELGIHKSTLYRKIKEYGIELPVHDGRSYSRKE